MAHNDGIRSLCDLSPSGFNKTILAIILKASKDSVIFYTILMLSVTYYVISSTIQLDDSYIYFRSVENFLHTGDFSFNSGESRNLMTSSGWFLVLATSKAVLPNADIVVFARLWSTIFLIASAALLFRIFRDRLPDIAPFSPLPVFFMPSIPGLAGHETGLALCMNLLLVWAFVARRPILFPVAAAAAYLARGESAVFAVILGLAYLCSDGITINRLLQKVRDLAVGFALALTMVGLWHGYHFLQTGSVFPDTLSAKVFQAESGYWPLFAWRIVTHLQNLSGTLGLWAHVVSLFGFWVLWRHVRPLAIWAPVHYLTLTAIGMPWYHWYYYPVELAVIIGFMAAGSHLARAIGKQIPVLSGVLPRAVLILAICFTAVAPLRHAIANTTSAMTDLASNIQHGGRPALAASRYSIYRELAEWITAHHARATDPVILTLEIGIVGYFAPNALVYDVVGLASAADTSEDIYDFEKYVGLHSPDYIIRIYADDPPDNLVFRSGPDQVRYVISLTRRQSPSGAKVALYSLDES